MCGGRTDRIVYCSNSKWAWIQCYRPFSCLIRRERVGRKYWRNMATGLWTKGTPNLSNFKQLIYDNVQKLKRANTIGVADFCKHKLERLIDSTGIKPDVDQLAPTASNGYCGISPGLMSYAKEEDIKLKTHGDPCCTPSAMSADINTIVQSADSRWKTMFVARYSQMSKDRLCITKKGFTAQFRLYWPGLGLGTRIQRSLEK